MIESVNGVGAVVWVLLPADRQREVDIITLGGGIGILLEKTEIKF
jgi:hypothetical protein